MKLPYAHVSRTLLVVVAAAGAVWLSAFFLPGAWVQPVPLLPVIGSVAGKVVAVAEPRHTTKHEAAAHRAIVTSVVARAPFVPPASVPVTAQSRPASHVVHRPLRANRPHHAAKPKRSAPVQTAAPASASATAASVSYSATTHAPRGRAVGWHRKHEESITTPAAATTHGHGRSHAKHSDAPSAQPAAAPTSTPTVPATPPPAGHDNGKHRGDDHDHGNQGHGDQGHGPGGKK
jgi:hypothetical protein